MAPKTRNEKVVREAGPGFSADKAGPCKQGGLVLLSGDYPGRGEGLAYWRERLGWLGEKPLRTVYNRYEAVGNPVHPDQSQKVRFVWVVTRGEWVEKGKVRDPADRRYNLRPRPRADDGPIQARKKGPGRPKAGTKRKAEADPTDEAPTGETTTGRPKRVCRKPRRVQS